MRHEGKTKGKSHKTGFDFDFLTVNNDSVKFSIEFRFGKHLLSGNPWKTR